jgi:Tfp pilus assembly protein PilN
MIRINLLSPDSIKKEERNEIVILAALFFILVVAIATINYALGLRTYNQIQLRVTQTEQELRKYETIVQQVETLKATKSVLETKKNVISMLMTGRLVYPKFMEQLSALLSGGVWFKSMTTQSQADGRMNIVLNGEASDNYSIADTLAAISADSGCSNVELGPLSTSNVNAQQKFPIVTYRITYDYKQHD